MDIVNNTQTEILNLIARFKFMVISHLQPLLGKSTGYVRLQLSSLTNQGLIKSFRLDRPGKAENMYYLTESGKELILQHTKVFDGNIKKKVIEKLSKTKGFEAFQHLFFFGTLSEIQQDCGNAWIDINGNILSFK